MGSGFITALSIVLIQLVDFIVHAASNQLEPLRVASTIIILAWIGVLLSRKMSQPTQLAITALASYLILNGIFIALEGFTNPAQGNAFRTALFLFVGATLGLSLWLVKQRKG